MNRLVPRGMRECCSVERTRLGNRYVGLVDLVFPELAQVVPRLTRRSIRRLLAERPTADEIAALELEELVDRLSRWSQRRFGREAQTGLGIQFDDEEAVPEGTEGHP